MKFKLDVKVILTFAFFILLLSWSNTAFCQKKYKSIENSIKSKDPKKMMASYEDFAKDYEKNNNFIKAKEYYLKAREQAILLNDSKKISNLDRKISLIEEQIANSNDDKSKNLDKSNDLKSNYKNANSKTDEGDLNSQLNDIDVKRIEAKTEKEEEQVIKDKIDIVSSSSRSKKESDEKISEEQTNSYMQLAENQIKQDNIDEAIQSYQQAIIYAENKPNVVAQMNANINDALLNKNRIEEAKAFNENLLKSPEIESNPNLKVKVINSLSTVYTKQNQDTKALDLLRQAYLIAKSTGQTLEAATIVNQIADLLIKSNNIKDVVGVQKDFIIGLKDVLDKDSSLIDDKYMQTTELKIKQLEEEKQLKDDVIKNRNRLNYFLMGGLSIMILLLWLLYKAYQNSKTANKKIALQSLRKEMNPHFIFNSLNSVNQFIANKDERTANQYLTKFSTLMRTVLDNSNRDFITLDDELQLIQNYLELEKQRFPDKFDFHIEVAASLDANRIMLPNMLIQPLVENAIWHGLRYKSDAGNLWLKIEDQSDAIKINVIDDGIGIEQSKNLKTMHQQHTKGVATVNINERISLLNDLYGLNITFTLLSGGDTRGTTAIINLPKSKL